MAINQTPYQRGFYDGSRGLTAVYYPPQPGNPHVEYQRGFEEGGRERDRLNSRPINPALKPETRALAEDTFARIESNNAAVDAFYRKHGRSQ